jgi:hypothetical protein
MSAIREIQENTIRVSHYTNRASQALQHMLRDAENLPDDMKRALVSAFNDVQAAHSLAAGNAAHIGHIQS